MRAELAQERVDRFPVGAPLRRDGASDQALHRREGSAPTKGGGGYCREGLRCGRCQG